MNKNLDSKLFYLAVGKNIKKYRDLRNYSLQVLGEKVGLTKKTIQRYENGEIKIDMDRLSDIAYALDVDMSQLLEGTESFLGIDLNDLDMVRLPIVGKISCGDGIIAFEDIEGYELTPKDWLNGGEYFYLRAKGDSMIKARIYDGDLLLIRRQPDVENGEIAAVLIGEETLLKRVYKYNDTIWLHSENDNYPPIVYTKTDQKNVIILGKLKKIVINV
jgi:repressor LexA